MSRDVGMVGFPLHFSEVMPPWDPCDRVPNGLFSMNLTCAFLICSDVSDHGDITGGTTRHLKPIFPSNPKGQKPDK